MQGQYSKLESITKRASKLLGDCKPSNIVKELKKLKPKDTGALEATNIALSLQVADLKVELSKKDEEIRQLKAQAKGLDQIREVVGTLGNVLNKVRLLTMMSK